MCKYREKPSAETFFWYRALWWPKKLLPLALPSSFVGHRELPEFLPQVAGVVGHLWQMRLGNWGLEVHCGKRWTSWSGASRAVTVSGAPPPTSSLLLVPPRTSSYLLGSLCVSVFLFVVAFFVAFCCVFFWILRLLSLFGLPWPFLAPFWPLFAPLGPFWGAFWDRFGSIVALWDPLWNPVKPMLALARNLV